MPRIFVTGDTHGQLSWSKLNMDNFPEQKKLTREDIVIVAGDWGGLWDNAGSDRYVQRWYNDKNFQLAWVDGNHENFELLSHFPVESWNGGKVHLISENIVHLMRGEIYTIGEKTIFCFGGADSIDKESRTIWISWWPEEIPNNAEMENGFRNLERVGNKVDYIITHECPTKVYQKIYYPEPIKPYVVSEYLEAIDDIVDYKQWYFGHHHIDLAVDKKHTALFNSIVEL